MTGSQGSIFADLMAITNEVFTPYWGPVIFICGILFLMLVIFYFLGTLSKNTDIEPLPTEDELFTDEI